MYVKQHIIEAEYSKEHILHGYGRATRELSYRPTYEYLDLVPKSIDKVEASPTVSDVKLENGVISYKVTASQGKRLDPYVSFTLDDIDTEKYNALRIVIDSDAAKNGKLYFTAGNTTKFGERLTESLCEQGASKDGTMTLIIYLADNKEYFDKLTSLRFDLGTSDGQEVKIYSVKAFYVNTDK